MRELRLEQNRRFGYDYLNTTNSVISQETEKEEKEKPTENTEAHSWIFQEEMYKDENIWKWKAQAQFNCLTVNCGISPVQEQPGRLHMCMQLSLHKRKTMNRFVGVFFPLSPFSQQSNTVRRDHISAAIMCWLLPFPYYNLSITPSKHGNNSFCLILWQF